MDKLLLALAVWRVTSLLVQEDGPYDVFAKLRRFIGVYYDEYSVKRGKNVVASAMTCVWCFSVWIALLFVLLFGETTSIAVFFVDWMSVSAIAIVVNEVVSWLKCQS